MEQQQIVSRLGCFTSSEIGKLLKSGRSKDKVFGDTALTYIREKISEIMTGERKQQPNSASLEWGIMHEMDALEHLKNRLIELGEYKADEIIFYGGANFKYFEYNEFSGGSPDGVATNAVLETKAPYCTSNHIEALEGSISDNHNEWLKSYNDLYYAQLQWNIESCGKSCGWWASYDPRIVNKKNRIAVLSIAKDEELIADIKLRLDLAVDKIRNTILKLS